MLDYLKHGIIGDFAQQIAEGVSARYELIYLCIHLFAIFVIRALIVGRNMLIFVQR